MRQILSTFLVLMCCSGMIRVTPDVMCNVQVGLQPDGFPPRTADELVGKNIDAKGGLAKIKAIKSLRMTGRLQQGDFAAAVGQEAKAPNQLRLTRPTRTRSTSGRSSSTGLGTRDSRGSGFRRISRATIPRSRSRRNRAVSPSTTPRQK
jgi:hypothetical protein